MGALNQISLRLLNAKQTASPNALLGSGRLDLIQGSGRSPIAVACRTLCTGRTGSACGPTVAPLDL